MIRTRKKIFFSCVPAAIVALIGFLGYAAFRSYPLYVELKSNPQWDRRMFTADPETGYAPIPDSCGHFGLGEQFRVSVCHDKRGFRVESLEAPDGEEARPLILALGDSFTYGWGIDARQAYPHLVAEGLGGAVKNGATNGYGLAHMLILARRHIATLKPDYVLVQYSPWLADRARTPLGTSRFSAMPQPYFSEASGKLEIAFPVFEFAGDGLPVSDYAGSRRSVGDFFSFLIRVGLPLQLENAFKMTLYRMRKALGFVPAPARLRRPIESAVLGEIEALCRENGARMIVVTIPNLEGTTGLIPEVVPFGVSAVRTDKVLFRMLPDTSSKTFLEHYGIPLAGRINPHYNPEANALVARAVLEAIEIASRKPGPGEEQPP